MDEHADWQLPQAEIDKLLDPAIKVFCLVNPSNPPSTKLSDAVLDRVGNAGHIEKRPDLMIVTDDVYGTFADDFVSLFAKCPRNTLCVYSFSKFFGATGWRPGPPSPCTTDNVFDQALLGKLPDAQTSAPSTRATPTLTTDTAQVALHRSGMVADSRAVALNHTAGLSVPQQLQMALFALNGLMDREHRYKSGAKQLIRNRYHTLFTAIWAWRSIARSERRRLLHA